MDSKAVKLRRRSVLKPVKTGSLSNSSIPLEEIQILPYAGSDLVAWDNLGENRDQHPDRRQPSSSIITWQGTIAVAILVGLLFLLVWKDLNGHWEKAEEIRIGSNQTAKRSSSPTEQDTVHGVKVADAAAAAGKALAVSSWPELLTYVRHPKRVFPIMENYYNSNQWRPREITRVLSSKSARIGGGEFLTLTFEDQDAKVLNLGLECTPDGWRLDWEQFVPLHEQEWYRFITEENPEPQTLRVSAIRRTPSPEQLALGGVSESDALGIMLWCTDVARGTRLAILHRDSDIAKDLADLISVDRGKRLILTLSSVDTPKGLRTDLVSIDEIANVGWTFIEESPATMPE
ncbi:MAG: hypothetical protein AAGD22_11395 [Verrucomicrobiota bacterium]